MNLIQCIKVITTTTSRSSMLSTTLSKETRSTSMISVPNENSSGFHEPLSIMTVGQTSTALPTEPDVLVYLAEVSYISV